MPSPRTDDARPTGDASALASMPYPACRLGDDGRVLEANARFEALTGWSAAALGDDGLAALFGPEADPDTARQVHAAILAGEVLCTEILCRMRTGSVFWNELVLVPERGGDGVPARHLAICRDVTARRTAETALGVRAAHDRLVLDRIQAGIVVHRASTEILYANAKATELLGVTHDTVLGAVNTDPRWGFIGSDGEPLPIDEYPVGKAVATRDVVRDLLIGITRSNDQRLKWLMCNAYPVLDGTGTVTEVVVSFTDVTALKQAERALQKSEERLRLALAGANDALWDVDLATGEAYYSPRWFEMLGYRPDDLDADAGLWVRLLHPDDRPRVLARLDEFAAGDATTYELEFRFVHREGRDVEVLSRGYIKRDAAGRAVRISGANTDVTERREHDMRVQQSRKMEAIGQLAGGVAHDFNNLLAVILGNLEIALAGDESPTAMREEIAEAMAAARRGADLTRRLLAFSRQQPLQAELVDVAATARDLGRVLQRLIGESIHVELDMPTTLPSVRVDASQLEHAILNLAINARDAMPNGGTLRIRAAVVTTRRMHRGPLADLPAGTYVRLVIADTGHGMPPDVLQRALDPFFTTKPLGRGTGLGLSSTYGFATQSGGTLTIDSTPGRGTTVTLYLPVVDLPAAASPAVDGERLAPRRADARATILVVEDEPSLRALCRRSLAMLGYTVLEAHDGPSAIATLTGGARVDLVLTDVVMPSGMSGRDLADEIVHRWPATRVLLMSGYTANLLDDPTRLGTHRLLEKPFMISGLAAAVRAELADASAARGAPFGGD